MKQTVLYDSNFKDFFKTEEKIKKSLSEVRNLTARGRDYLKSYEFIVECTKIYNASDEDDAIAKFMLLSTFDDEAKTNFILKDEAFVAFYFACFHYYRQKNVNALRATLNRYVGSGEKKFSIDDYPVIWDLACRYSVLTNDYEHLLISSVLGAKAMDDSPAMGNSFVQAVCNKSKNAYYKNVKVVDENYPECFSQRQTGVTDDTAYPESLIRAYGYAFLGIKKNPSYAKYYASVAELLFYTRVYLANNGEDLDEVYKKGFVTAIKPVDDKVTFDDLISDNAFTSRYVEKYISVAKGYASGETEIANYDRFRDMAWAFFDKRADTIFAQKNKIITSKRFQDCLDVVPSNASPDYITISYSRKDYKSVLCDVVELKSRGIQVIFDEHLDETSETDGATWDTKFEKILKDSKAVLCYLSENYISSPSVEKELNMMAKYRKAVIPVDLTGKKLISEIIKSALKNGSVIGSDMLRAITSVFDDAKLVLPREQNYDAVLHFTKLEQALRNQCPEVFKNVKATVLIDKNVSDNVHPQEDAYIFDETNNLYVVADGITRQEGYVSDYSLSAKFTAEFLKIFEKSFNENMKLGVKNYAEILHKIFVKSSESAKESLLHDKKYCQALSDQKALAVKNQKYFEPSGCVSAVALIDNGTLYYGHVGDCGIVLIRNGQVITLTRSQTDYAFKIDKAEKDRKLLYDKYVNNPSNEHGYGVVNGDAGVSSFFFAASFKLLPGDVVYVMTDGIKDFLTERFVSGFNDLDLQEIFDMQKESSFSLDDRTAIKIKY